MIPALALILFAVALALLGPIALRAGDWTHRAPRLGVAAWQALTASLLIAVLLAGASLAVPALPWPGDLASFVRLCLMALRDRYSTPGGAIVSTSAVVADLVVLTRLAYSLASGTVRTNRLRRHQWDVLSSAGQRRQGSDALVVEHHAASVYCLPGRGDRIVVTTAALEVLDPAQLHAVIAHERAHQRGHHHLVAAVAEAIRAAFPAVRLFRDARDEIGELIELLADDSAARRSDRLTVATALVRLSGYVRAPKTALRAGGDTALLRVNRLVAPTRPLGVRGTLLATLALLALLAAPLTLALAPASSARAMPPCPPVVDRFV